MGRPTISVLLPTIRPGSFRRSLASVAAAAGAVPCETVVVADFDMVAAPEGVLWLRRERRGPIAAIEEAYRASRGEYVFVLNDESTLDPCALEILYDVAVARPWAVYSPEHLPAFDFRYYGREFAAFPFARRNLVEELGGLFDTAYGGFYADPDLSMRAHAAGIPVRVVEGAILRHANNMAALGHQENMSAYLAADRALFRSRWDHLGEFRDPV